MKIALIRQKYTPFGGAERYMARLADGLMAEGHEVHVCAAKWDAGGNTGLQFHPVPVAAFPGWLKALTFSLNCRKIVEREGFDVVFSLERTLRQDIYRAGDGCHRQWLVQKNLGKGLLSRALTYCNPFQLAYLHLERRLFTDPALRAIIANSQRGKIDIVRLYGVDPDKVRVIYNGVDPLPATLSSRQEQRAALADRYRLTGELRILYVGSGFKRKGVPALIRGVSKLNVPYRLFVVGKGNAGPLRRLAQSLGIGENVVFTGPVKDVERFYMGCDVFAFPTLYDPFSNATLEAMSCGLPVVTTPFNGAAELIDNGVNGFVVDDPFDAEAIAESLTHLGPEDVRLAMGAKAQEKAAAFTMQRNVRETLEVILAVAGGE